MAMKGMKAMKAMRAMKGPKAMKATKAMKGPKKMMGPLGAVGLWAWCYRPMSPWVKIWCPGKLLVPPPAMKKAMRRAMKTMKKCEARGYVSGSSAPGL